MSSKEIVSPVVANVDVPGVVFYISNDGKTTAVSVTGLNILIGNDARSAIFGEGRTLGKLARGEGHTNSYVSCLKPYHGRVFAPHMEGSDGAILVDGNAAAAILEYYAYDRKKPEAIINCRKFLQKGFNTWVKEITGYAASNQYDKLLETMQLVLNELQSVKAEVKQLHNLKAVTTTVYPGLDGINNGLSSADAQRVIESKDLFTANDWLNLKGIILDKSDKSRFTRLCSDTYTSMTGDRPKVKYKPRVDKNGETKWIKDANGYRLIDFHILEAAYKHLNRK